MFLRSKSQRRFLISSTLAVSCALASGLATAQIPQDIPNTNSFCVRPLDPIPTGVSAKPNEGFPAIFGPVDHRFIHSSTHLQGKLAQVKWAGGLVYQPAGTAFDGYTSALVINNPDPIVSCVVDINYYDAAGTVVQQTLGLTIPPEQLRTDAPTLLAASAGNLGVGSAEVTVTNGCPGIIGAVLMHTNNVLGITDPDDFGPGAASKQQLQVKPSRTELFWGPLPVTNVTAIDFFNGNAPAFWVVNPNDVANTVRVDLTVFDRATGNSFTINWRTVTLPANGALFEASGPHLAAIGSANPGLWNQIISLYFPPLGLDWDLIVHVVSEDNLPILGDGLMTDFVGDDGGDNLVIGGRYRMASTMLANNPNWLLVDPDFSYDPGGIIETYIGVANVGTIDAGPVAIEYYNAAGTRISTGTVSSLPPNTSIRIEPGTFGYPTAQVGFGWVRIFGCKPSADLVGWTVREVQDFPGVSQFQKAFGETLLHTTSAEPGVGFTAGGMTRKLKPISRVNPFFFWPGYTTFVNQSIGNIGAYNFELLLDSATFSCGVLGPFAGLPWAETSSTYEDSFNICNPTNISVAVDHTSGEIEGIGVIGDPLVEWLIPGLAGN